MKVIIDINEETYADTIHDSEYDTLQLGITLKEIVKNGTPLEDELEMIKMEIIKLTRYCTTKRGINLISDNAVYRIINKRIAKLKGEKK